MLLYNYVKHAIFKQRIVWKGASTIDNYLIEAM